VLESHEYPRFWAFMNFALDFTNNGIHEQWKIRTVVYPSGKPLFG
jgi:hypothetical protein